MKKRKSSRLHKTLAATQKTKKIDGAPASHMSSAQRRRQLVRIATELFARRGFYGITTREIAARAHVSEAIIFRHFASKHDLYRAVLGNKIEESGIGIQKALGNVTTSSDNATLLATLVVELSKLHKKDPTLLRLLLFSLLEGHELTAAFLQSTVDSMNSSECGALNRGCC